MYVDLPDTHATVQLLLIFFRVHIINRFIVSGMPIVLTKTRFERKGEGEDEVIMVLTKHFLVTVS